jgi:hypothetical protein
MKPAKDDNIVDLIVPEDDLLVFHLPSSMDAVRSAYSKTYKKKQNDTLEEELEDEELEHRIKHIERLFPKKTKQKETDKKDNPGFSIDQDEDPLII